MGLRVVLGFSGCFIWLAYSLAPLCHLLDEGAAGKGKLSGNLPGRRVRVADGDGAGEPAHRERHLFTRRYKSAALAVLVAILSWVTDNLGCRQLHS